MNDIKRELSGMEESELRKWLQFVSNCIATKKIGQAVVGNQINNKIKRLCWYLSQKTSKKPVSFFAEDIKTTVVKLEVKPHEIISDTQVSFEQERHTADHCNDVGSEMCQYNFKYFGVGTTVILFLTDFFSECEIERSSNIVELKAVLSTSGCSVCGIVVQRNECSVVLRLDVLGVLLQVNSGARRNHLKVASERSELRFRPTALAQRPSHLSASTLADWRDSLLLNSRFLALKAALAQSPLAVSDKQWQSMDRSSERSHKKRKANSGSGSCSAQVAPLSSNKLKVGSVSDTAAREDGNSAAAQPSAGKSPGRYF